MDIYEVLEAHRRISAEDWITSANVAISPNMDADNYRKFIDSLRKQAGHTTVTKKPEFDALGFEALKAQLASGR
ncbi:hypothetical protein NQ117_05250 [Paenibacillus sp. SC116]|uniref:hypothetical protein n=1 Tax=Paenibacillus sp. SC116 TaxID=2968986 RepID=UPI00215AB567|nr:hypothetical protein [Paenibacillus sp. SC116]MCR8843078.1 hypothetical protein [Paenibacillus sp. SC116]